MDSPYRRFGSIRSRCISCFRNTSNEDDDEEHVNITELIQVLNIKLQGIRYQMNEKQLTAQKYAKDNDMIRGRVELELYHFKKSQYEQLAGIYRRANMIRDTVSHTESVVAVSKTMKRESKTMNLLIDNLSEIDDLMTEWDSIVEQSNEASKQLSLSDETAAEELEELKHIELSFALPNVPSNTPAVSDTRRSSPSQPVLL